MNQAAIPEWLPQLQRIGVALVIGFVPALIASWKRRPMTHWYLYGVVCALLAWPAGSPRRRAPFANRTGRRESSAGPRDTKAAAASGLCLSASRGAWGLDLNSSRHLCIFLAGCRNRQDGASDTIGPAGRA
jgi:hypothetical protein